MKNTIKFFGIIALAAIIVFAMAACGDSGSGGEDTTHTHSYSGWTTKTLATCTAAAVEKRTCSCGEEDTRNSTINLALGHDIPGIKAATCETEGNTGSGTCSRCSEEGTNQVIAALLHDATGAAATCTTAKVCARPGCDRVLETELGHLSNSWNWATYNASNGGRVSCTQSGCGGGFASIGDTGPAGGIIFYVADNQEGRLPVINVVGYTGTTGSFDSYNAYYLEAVPGDMSDMSTLLAWFSFGHYSDLISGTGIAIGTGKGNTARMLAVDPDAPAAKVCVDYGNETAFDDWFLPSKDELNELYTQREHVGITITKGRFWSSSMYDEYNLVWGQDFFNGVPCSISKVSSPGHYIHAIRAF